MWISLASFRVLSKWALAEFARDVRIKLEMNTWSLIQAWLGALFSLAIQILRISFVCFPLKFPKPKFKM